MFLLSLCTYILSGGVVEVRLAFVNLSVGYERRPPMGLMCQSFCAPNESSQFIFGLLKKYSAIFCYIRKMYLIRFLWDLTIFLTFCF